MDNTPAENPFLPLTLSERFDISGRITLLFYAFNDQIYRSQLYDWEDFGDRRLDERGRRLWTFGAMGGIDRAARIEAAPGTWEQMIAGQRAFRRRYPPDGKLPFMMSKERETAFQAYLQPFSVLAQTQELRASLQPDDHQPLVQILDAVATMFGCDAADLSDDYRQAAGVPLPQTRTSLWHTHTAAIGRTGLFLQGPSGRIYYQPAAILGDPPHLLGRTDGEVQCANHTFRLECEPADWKKLQDASDPLGAALANDPAKRRQLTDEDRGDLLRLQDGLGLEYRHYEDELSKDLRLRLVGSADMFMTYIRATPQPVRPLEAVTSLLPETLIDAVDREIERDPLIAGAGQPDLASTDTQLLRNLEQLNLRQLYRQYFGPDSAERMAQQVWQHAEKRASRLIAGADVTGLLYPAVLPVHQTLWSTHTAVVGDDGLFLLGRSGTVYFQRVGQPFPGPLSRYDFSQRPSRLDYGLNKTLVDGALQRVALGHYFWHDILSPDSDAATKLAVKEPLPGGLDDDDRRDLLDLFDHLAQEDGYLRAYVSDELRAKYGQDLPRLTPAGSQAQASDATDVAPDRIAERIATTLRSDPAALRPHRPLCVAADLANAKLARSEGYDLHTDTPLGQELAQLRLYQRYRRQFPVDVAEGMARRVDNALAIATVAAANGPVALRIVGASSDGDFRQNVLPALLSQPGDYRLERLDRARVARLHGNPGFGASRKDYWRAYAWLCRAQLQRQRAEALADPANSNLSRHYVEQLQAYCLLRDATVGVEFPLRRADGFVHTQLHPPIRPSVDALSKKRDEHWQRRYQPRS